ncbi:MAG: Ig-like domain-containing protein [Kofleriaceae bacterium]|nr:Ig-like domain-containing protein [Kofleriaceae bacterium]
MAALLVPVVSGCASDDTPALATSEAALSTSFQRGTASYTGTIDGEISSRGGNNGSQDFVDNDALITRNTRRNYESEALVRFSDLTLPAGAIVTSAQIVLTFRDREAGHALRGHYITTAWTQTAANWRRRTADLSWATPGARGLGTDIASTPAFIDTTWLGTGVIRKTYALDAATVQRWIDTPAANLGLLLFTTGTANRELRMFTSEHGTRAHRPQLVINYELPDRTLPTVALTAPTNGTTFDGNTPVLLTAAASDNVGVVGVQFVVDGEDVGGEDTTPPYEATFTTGTADATHVISARARDAAGNLGTAAPVTIVVEYVEPDREPPSVAITSPVAGAAFGLNQAVTLAAMASDNIGVTGVQFVVDGADVGSEDTAPPYEATFTTGNANANHVITARARDAAGNVRVADAVAITVEPPAPTITRPRIWIDETSLAALRQRAAGGDARWTALQARCNTYLPGIVRPPDAQRCQDSCSGSTICCGYQGERYYPAMLELALCYQIGKGLTPPATNTAAWAQKGVEVLTQLAAFTNFTADHGYGIRNFGPAMAIGYDWLHDVVSPTLATTVADRLVGWIDWYDAQPASYNFREHPTSNYFAGYYAAKALAALALEGEHAKAAELWDEWLAMQRDALGSHMGIAPYYTRYLDGGGWIQGWQYGPRAVRNMIEPSLAAMTAKDLDLVEDATTPYRYAVNNALHLMHFSTPSLTMMDDRDELASFNPQDPGRCPSNAQVPVSTALTLTEMLRRWPAQTATGVDVAPYFQSFTRAVRSIYAPDVWQDMLYWDNAAPELDFDAARALVPGDQLRLHALRLVDECRGRDAPRGRVQRQGQHAPASRCRLARDHARQRRPARRVDDRRALPRQPELPDAVLRLAGDAHPVRLAGEPAHRSPRHQRGPRDDERLPQQHHRRPEHPDLPGRHARATHPHPHVRRSRRRRVHARRTPRGRVPGCQRRHRVVPRHRVHAPDNICGVRSDHEHRRRRRSAPQLALRPDARARRLPRRDHALRHRRRRGVQGRDHDGAPRQRHGERTAQLLR